MTTNLPKGYSDNLFYFFEIFYTHYHFFSIFVNSRKNRVLPIGLDEIKFITMSSVLQNKFNIDHCGVYSYISQLIEQKKLLVDCVNLMFSEKLNLPLTNLIIRDKKTAKINNVSKTLLLPADGAIMSLLFNAPISIDDASIPFLTIPVIDNTVELPLFIDSIKNSIMIMEENKAPRTDFNANYI